MSSAVSDASPCMCLAAFHSRVTSQHEQYNSRFSALNLKESERLSHELPLAVLIEGMLALSRRSCMCIRPTRAALTSMPTLCFRGIHQRFASLNSCQKIALKRSTSFAMAVSCAAVGSFFMSQAALSDSGHPPPAVVASVPPSSQTFASSGVVPSGSSPFTLSYSAGKPCFASPLFVSSRIVSL